MFHCSYVILLGLLRRRGENLFRVMWLGASPLITHACGRAEKVWHGTSSPPITHTLREGTESVAWCLLTSQHPRAQEDTERKSLKMLQYRKGRVYGFFFDCSLCGVIKRK